MDEQTLDQMRVALARELPRHAAFDGWSDAALDRAAAATGIEPAIAHLAFPAGAAEMIDAWFAEVDAAMLDALPADRLATMKISARITALVEARLDLLHPDIEALRRALSVLTMPRNLACATRLGWRAADTMWRAAGDTATDYNHYTKRLLLSGVYASTLMTMLGDESESLADTRAFLARRIDGVMRFEKLKARFTHLAPDRLSLGRFLGRLRYPTV